MTNSHTGRFTKSHNAGTATCSFCGKTRQKANMQRAYGPDTICNDCYDLAGLENEHLDGGHEPGSEPTCPMCKEGAK